MISFFGLPEAPFAGLNVSLLLNTESNRKSLETKEEGWRKRWGPFWRGYSEMHKNGLYHEIVNETPDLVVALNPGFVHYPTKWWPTLQHLRQFGVPIIATGYANAFDTSYRAVPVYFAPGAT